MRNYLILFLLLAVGSQGKEGSPRTLQDGAGHPCAKPEFTMGCNPEVFPAKESRARFCDADGSVLLDGIPRSICTGYSTLSLLVLGDDYCGYCVPTSEPSESPSLSPVTSAPVTPTPVTPAPVILPAPILPTPVPGTSSPDTPSPVTPAPSGSSLPSSTPSDGPSVNTPSPSGSSMPSGVPSDTPTVAATATPSGSSLPSSIPSAGPSVATPLPSGSPIPSNYPSVSPSITDETVVGASDTATPTAPATILAGADPPVFNSFSRENPICEVCGAGFVVENITNEFFLPGNNPPIQCGEFQLLGAMGRIPAFLCSTALKTIFMEPNCGCIAAA